MSPRINKGNVVIQFIIEGYYNKQNYHTIINNIKPFYKSKGFIPSHPNTFITAGITTVSTYN